MDSIQGPNLVQPPQMPTSIIMSEGSNKELYNIYSQIIQSEKILYRNVLRKLHSSDYVEVPGIMEIPDENGQIQRIPNPEVRIVKLPSSRKICERCHTIKEEEWVFCENCKQPTVYFDWKPILNENGFNNVASSILAGTDEIMSTGNVNVDKKGEQMPLKEMALQSMSAILSSITENIYDWSATGEPNITEGQYKELASMISDHFYFVMSRSKDAYLLEGMRDTSKIQFNAGNPSRGDFGGSEKSQGTSLKDIFFGK